MVLTQPDFWGPFARSLSFVRSLLQSQNLVYHEHSPLWETPCCASCLFLQG
uniref:Uncharacterized protein n=1 Tax=Arundo donax TaxID=35708 RepID=A0A0A8YE66_ARUDO